MIETDVLKSEAIPSTEVGSNALSVKEETLNQLGEYLKMRYGKLKTFREQSDWEKEKAAAFNAYHMVPRKRAIPFPGAANFPSPFARIGVDAFHANVMASLFPTSNRMDVVPLIIQKDFVNTAKRAADYMTYVMNHEADSYMVIDDWDRKAQMYGIAYIEPSYIKEQIWETVDVTTKKNEVTVDPMTGKPSIKEKVTTKKEKKKKTVFDGIKLNSWPVESIYKSPFLLSIEQCVKEDVVFKVFEITWSEVQERSKSSDDKPSFYRKAQVDKIYPSIKDKMYKHLTELEQARADIDGFFMDMMSKEERVDMCEAHLWWDIDNDDIKEEIKATFHPFSGVVVRVSLGKCRIVENNPRPVDGRGYGHGIPKVCDLMSDEWEVFHNTRANAGQWENTTFGFYRAGGRSNPSAITIMPGKFYPVDDPREVVFAQPPRTGQSYFQEEGLMWNIFERVLALDENMQGIGSQRKRTATENINVASRSSIRFGNPFNRTVTAVNKLLNHIWELNRECAPEEKEFYVVGEGGAPMFDKLLKYEYSSNMQFSVAVSSVFDQQLVRDTALMAYRLFLVNPFVQQHPEIMWEFSQKTLDALKVDIDLPKPPQAKVASAFEVIEMIRRGDPVEPEIGIDYDHHLKVCMAKLNAESIHDWAPEEVERLVLYIDKTKILKQTLESANLNKSGQFTGKPMDKQPPVTSNRNPTQRFNTTKVGENSNSAKQNVSNGQNNENMDKNISSVMGNEV